MDNKRDSVGFIERRNSLMRLIVEEAVFIKETIGMRAAGDILDAYQVPGHIIWRVFVEQSGHGPC